MAQSDLLLAADADHVVIVGAGFSGTLLAINLLRHQGPRVTLVERRPEQLARGVAYSAAHPDHLLNVRAERMSALPDEPGHFVEWLAREGKGDRHSFVPRRIYGAYLRAMLDAATAQAGGRLRLVTGEVRGGPSCGDEGRRPAGACRDDARGSESSGGVPRDATTPTSKTCREKPPIDRTCVTRRRTTPRTGSRARRRSFTRASPPEAAASGSPRHSRSASRRSIASPSRTARAMA